ncbi:DsrE family protein [Alcanivorax quisquiliarum]|uniref:DsrE family protein n=1 Tax=Alcanivorax quisquiliarum TaxID=2933565 RepID=A0ABT0E3A2_9GAMM|nr:DsrE family protein [Alcanivorax quisquiliarum]MCK0536302.1 DsrE family protein [Alcanivorax quisquiliarum]
MGAEAITAGPQEVVLLCRSAPGQDQALPELLDMALTTAVFGQSVALLLVGDGVRHLQPPSADSSFAEALASLVDYGIQGWVDEGALREAGIAVADLPSAFRAASMAEIAAVMAASRHLWGW